LARFGRPKLEPTTAFPATCGDQAAADAFLNADFFTDIQDFCNEQITALNQKLPANFTLLWTRAGLARPVTY
jgi:hypothetical protein